MTVIGLILSVFGIGFFCWLFFTLAIYALPFFAGLHLGRAAAAPGRARAAERPSTRLERASADYYSRFSGALRPVVGGDHG